MMLRTDSLSPVQKTMLITLTGRALDVCKERPILGDHLAAQVRGGLGSDVGVVRVPSSVMLATALRSRMLDRAVGDFTAANPTALDPALPMVSRHTGYRTRPVSNALPSHRSRPSRSLESPRQPRWASGRTSITSLPS